MWVGSGGDGGKALTSTKVLGAVWYAWYDIDMIELENG